MIQKRKDLLDRCLACLDEQELIDFTRELIQIQSFPPAYNERDVALAIQKKFAEYGIDAVIEDLDQPNRANLRASIGQEEGTHLVFSGHMDTVPPVDTGWDRDPFGAQIEGNYMYGRGTGDMKAGDAALILAMCCLKKAGIPLSGKLSFVATAGEEVDMYGSKAYAKAHGTDDIDAMVIAEASDEKIIVAEKGALWLKFTAYGKAAHPGVSWEGVNALLNTLKFYEKFRHYQFAKEADPFLGANTLNVTTMHAGTITNALPEICVSTVDIRTIPDISHDDILRDVDNVLDELRAADPDFKMEYEILNNSPCLSTDLDDPLTQAAFDASETLFGKKWEPSGVFFYTDAVSLPHSDGSYAPLLIIGPGKASRNHKVNECVEIDQIIECAKLYMGTAINYLTEA